MRQDVQHVFTLTERDWVLLCTCLQNPCSLRHIVTHICHDNYSSGSDKTIDVMGTAAESVCYLGAFVCTCTQNAKVL